MIWLSILELCIILPIFYLSLWNDFRWSFLDIDLGHFDGIDELEEVWIVYSCKYAMSSWNCKYCIRADSMREMLPKLLVVMWTNKRHFMIMVNSVIEIWDRYTPPFWGLVWQQELARIRLLTLANSSKQEKRNKSLRCLIKAKLQ